MTNRRQLYWRSMMADEGSEVQLQLERDAGGNVTFSEDAMNDLYDQMLVFVGTRIMRRWQATNEPPTLLVIDMKVTVG